jgi:hypothetical protein
LYYKDPAAGIYARSHRRLHGARSVACNPLALVLYFPGRRGHEDRRRLLPLAAEDRALIATGVLLHEVTTADARIAATAAGALPYFAGRYSIDTLGKCDPVIAHEPPRVGTRLSEALDFVPGHAKWDYAYTLGVLKPDLVIGLGGKREEAVPYLRDYGLLLERPAMVAVRKNSTVVLWEKLARKKAQFGAN